MAEAVSSGRIGGRDLKKLPQHGEPTPDIGVTHEAPQDYGTLDTAASLPRSLENLEEAVYELAARCAFHEIAKEMGDEGR